MFIHQGDTPCIFLMRVVCCARVDAGGEIDTFATNHNLGYRLYYGVLCDMNELVFIQTLND